MYNYSYYPSKSKEFAVGAEWQPWKKIARRKTPISRTLKKPIFLKKDRFNNSMPTAWNSNFKEVNLPKFNIFGNGSMGLSVTKFVGIVPSIGVRSGSLRKNSDKFSVFNSQNKFLRNRKSSV